MRTVLVRLRNNFVQLAVQERTFLLLLAAGFFIAGATYDYPYIAMWVGFGFAGYSAVANDSIQTLGTFLASNRQRPWWILWLFIGGIFIATMGYSWWVNGGDVSYGRLASKGFETAPTNFHFLAVAAPLFLMVLTRMRMPVSTTLLLLSSFATEGKAIGAVTLKSIGGYGIAFVVALVIWFIAGRAMKRWLTEREAHPMWVVAQWVATGFLWSVWLMQDAANIAVYLPRAMSGWEFVGFAGLIFAGLGVLFRMGGERIQQVVDEKSNVVDVRAATIINVVFGAILYVFKIHSQVPMSTTWVFIGLLAGRELALTLRGAGEDGRTLRDGLKLAGRDLLYATIGFIVALILAAAINPVISEALFE